jgi:hypothetical protein
LQLHTYLKRIPDVELGIDLGGVEWQSFLKALHVRHRIVHPKVTSEIKISDSEKELVMKVSLWFNYTVIDRLLESYDSLATFPFNIVNDPLPILVKTQPPKLKDVGISPGPPSFL